MEDNSKSSEARRSNTRKGGRLSRRQLMARAARYVAAATAVAGFERLPGVAPFGDATAWAAPATAAAVVGIRTEDVSLDPNQTIAIDWMNVLLHMYDTLTTRTRDGKLEGSLAESFRNVSDTVWEFQLRRGITFHGGEPFTAADVKFTLDRVLDPNSKLQQRGYISTIKEVQAVGPYTVRITTNSPDPLIAENLQLVPIASGTYVKQRGDAYLAAHPNGTGAYKFVEWMRGDHLTLAGNLGYRQGAPKIRSGIFRVIPEEGTLLAALQTGEIDIAVNLSPDIAVRFRGATNFSIKAAPSQRSVYLVLDPAYAPLKDTRVRQALNYGVDKDGIIKDILLGFAQPLPTMVGPMYRGYNSRLKPYPHDVEKAKALLRDAGYANGFPLTLYAPNGRYLKDKEVAEAIAGQYGQIGVKTSLQILEWGDMLNRYRDHKLSPSYMIGFGTPTWDFVLAFRSYLLPENAQCYWRDPALTKVVQQIGSTVNPQKRAQLSEALNERLYNDPPFVYLYLQQAIYGTSSRVVWEPRVDERVWLYEASIRA